MQKTQPCFLANQALILLKLGFSSRFTIGEKGSQINLRF